MFDRASILKLLAANVLGLAFIYARFSQTPKGVIFNLQVQAWLSQFIPGARVNCGLLKWEDYYITSDRVLLEDGFQPAACACLGEGEAKQQRRGTPERACAHRPHVHDHHDVGDDVRIAPGNFEALRRRVRHGGSR